MRTIPYRLFLLCFIVPAVLYVLTLHYVETILNRHIVQTVPTIVLPNTAAVNAGLERVETAVARNIRSYLQQQWFTYAGLSPFILVSSGDGKILYPPSHENTELSLTDNKDAVLHENQTILQRGLLTDVNLHIDHSSVFAIGSLLFYVSISGSILGYRVRISILQHRQQEAEAQYKLEQLRLREQDLSSQLDVLNHERDSFALRLEHVRSDLQSQQAKFTTQEEELLQEIITLEERFQSQIETQHVLEEEIQELRAEIERQRSKSESPKKSRGEALLVRRLQTLYKNLELHARALEGFVALNEELQLKAEEILQQLNISDELSVKRKITGRRLSFPIFEIPFGYRGRLYFAKKEARIEILAIGDKNSQGKDLDYLEKL